METSQADHMKDLPLRHALATLAYRGSKALRGAPAGFEDFRPRDGSRSAGEILAHLGDLMDWALTQASGDERWRTLKPCAWDPGSERFFTALTKLDAYLLSDAPLHVPSEKLFQGAIADALTHIGQIAMLRRLADAPIRGENYSIAKIEAGNSGSTQPAPVKEFD
jgi:hypothetical protein